MGSEDMVSRIDPQRQLPLYGAVIIGQWLATHVNVSTDISSKPVYLLRDTEQSDLSEEVHNMP